MKTLTVTKPQSRVPSIVPNTTGASANVDNVVALDGIRDIIGLNQTAPVSSRVRATADVGADFRGRRPPELTFGTGCLRAPVKDITDLEAYINARGFLEHALEVGDVTPGEKISIAGDLRSSTDGPSRSILRAVARAITDLALHVENLGHVPTPALTFYSFQRRRPSIMVTGSHAPFDHNGLKFYLSTGEPLKDDQPAIQRAIRRVRRTEYARPEGASIFDDQGMFKAGQDNALPAVNSQACFDYLCRYLNFFQPDALDGMRIIVYEHSAVGRDLLMVLLVSLGAEVIPMGRSDDFVPVDTEVPSQNTLALLQDFADRARREHGHFDAIVSTDPDSDRPFLAAITIDGQVKHCSGDLLGILTADFLDADAVAVPITSNDAADRWAAAQGISIVKTRVGSTHVIEAMQEARAQGATRVVGWEANGGFLTATDIVRNGRTLATLPSRDAALPLLAALCAANERRIPLLRLLDELPGRFLKTGFIDNVSSEAGLTFIERFSPMEPDIEDMVITQSYVSLRRADGRIESINAGAAPGYLAKCRELQRFFTAQSGFDGILRVNSLDGLRIWFGNGDIAHIRHSGTGPQLRIYAVADTPGRAEQIVAFALREPDGILRCMETAAAAPVPELMPDLKHKFGKEKKPA